MPLGKDVNVTSLLHSKQEMSAQILTIRIYILSCLCLYPNFLAK